MRFVVVAGLLALSLFLSGCGDASDDGDAPAGFTTPPRDGEAYVITLTSGPAFSPDKASVPEGATVVFRSDIDGCDVRSAESGGPDSSQSQYGNGLIPRGGAYEWTAPEAEFEFHLHCTLHEEKGMTAVLRVG